MMNRIKEEPVIGSDGLTNTIQIQSNKTGRSYQAENKQLVQLSAHEQRELNLQINNLKKASVNQSFPLLEIVKLFLEKFRYLKISADGGNQ